MSGTDYVIDQLGLALRASHEALAQQQQQIEQLQAALAAQQNPANTGDATTR